MKVLFELIHALPVLYVPLGSIVLNIVDLVISCL